MRFRRSQIIVLLLITLLLSGCLSTRPMATSPEQEGLGSFSVSSPSFGPATLRPSTCSAGDREFFLGADFKDNSSDLVLRLVIDPLEGPAVRVFSIASPFDKSIVFRLKECRVFQFSLVPTGWRVNYIYDHSLTLQLDCTRDGESIQGNASATHCH